MNIDELKQSLTTVADEVDDLGSHDRLAGVESKVATRRRTTILGTSLAAAVAIVAVAVAPSVLDGADDRTPPTDPTPTRKSGNPDVDETSLPTVVEKGTTFYTEPAGASLFALAVADPDQQTLTMKVVPRTLDLSWTDFCWDPSVKDLDNGADFKVFINGTFIGGSTCGGRPYGPIEAESSFGGSSATNEETWAQYGVQVGQSFEMSIQLRQHGEHSSAHGVDPRMGLAIFERAPEQQIHGVGLNPESIFKGHLYRLVASQFGEVVDGERTRITLDLPESDQKLYVERGAAHVRGALVVDGGPQLGSTSFQPGVSTGGSSGDLVSPDRGSITVSGWGREDSPASGTIYALVYELVE